MADPKQLWELAGGNGAGKSTFHYLYLAKYGIKFVNADLIAKDIDPEDPGGSSYYAATVKIQGITDTTVSIGRLR